MGVVGQINQPLLFLAAGAGVALHVLKSSLPHLISAQQSLIPLEPLERQAAAELGLEVVLEGKAAIRRSQPAQSKSSAMAAAEVGVGQHPLPLAVKEPGCLGQAQLLLPQRQLTMAALLGHPAERRRRNQILAAEAEQEVALTTLMPQVVHLFLAGVEERLEAGKTQLLLTPLEHQEGKTELPFLTQRQAGQLGQAQPPEWWVLQAQMGCLALQAAVAAVVALAAHKAAQEAQAASPAAVAVAVAHLSTQAQRARVAQGAAASSW